MSDGYKEESYNKVFLVVEGGTRRLCYICELEFAPEDARIHAQFPCKVRIPDPCVR